MKNKKRIKNAIQNVILLFITCSLLFGILEIYLRVFNPFEFRVKGDKIILPANKKYVINNDKTEKLDKIIVHTKNSLGFRGDELPNDFGNNLTIIAVGGSTTECFHTSDGKTWIDILGKRLGITFKRLWINNAGLNGQSTFGHIILMEDYIKQLRPKVVLFLVGSNDRENRNAYNKYEKLMIKHSDLQSFKARIRTFANYSEVLGCALNIYRYFKARNMGLTHGIVDYRKKERVEVPENMKKKIRQKINNISYKPYKKRLKRLIEISRENGIEPVFLTQPTLYGKAIDDITNVNLANIKTGDGMSGEMAWEKLEIVNDVVRQVGKEEKVLIIDLSEQLPKSSQYYYDFIHFSNKGNEKVAKIVSKKLCNHLAENYSEFLRKDYNCDN